MITTPLPNQDFSHLGVAYKAPRRTDAISPFRYPGGKGFLLSFLAEETSRLNGLNKHYVEPFAGGAGAALSLLKKGFVQEVHLNDFDLRVYSAWRAMLEETDRFVERIQSVDVSLDTWAWSRSQLESPKEYSFELGFAAFFVNRTSRAGILMGSGPIGGYGQTGKWKMDARFYRKTLADRVRWIGDHKASISVTHQRATDFLRKKAVELPREATYYFIDPPYVRAGARLYLNAMSLLDHAALASLVDKSTFAHWSMTYDDHPEIRRLYKSQKIRSLSVAYSLGRRRTENEVLITP